MLSRMCMVLIVLALSGCAEFTAGKAAALNTAASVNDEAVQLSIDGLCSGYSVGSIQRRFMRSQEDWETWNQLCRGDRALTLPETGGTN